jgi:methionyl-tRNA formyltransferase
MRLVILAYDFFIDAIKKLSTEHQIVALFTFETDNTFDFNHQIISLGAEKCVPVYFHRPTSADFELLVGNEGVDAFFSMGYLYKAPASERWRGINLHPTLLPLGRGRWPLPWLILKYPEAGGLTLHKHDENWDTGDILCQEPINVYPEDNLETLSARIRMRATPFVADAVSRLGELWADAKRQDNGTYWEMPSRQDRTLPWAAGVDAILRVVRAFGNFESIAEIGADRYSVTDAYGWTEPHHFEPGTLVTHTGSELIVAAADGFILVRRIHVKGRIRTSQAGGSPNY